MDNNNRNIFRVSLTTPIQLMFGSQVSLAGQIKDISLKSAFVLVKSSIHMDTNDELKFCIEKVPNYSEIVVKGSAYISRVSPGEGIAIVFNKMDEASTNHLQKLVNALAGA